MSGQSSWQWKKENESCNWLPVAQRLEELLTVAEICRRRNGIIAQGLPETVSIGEIQCSSEVFTQEGQKDRTVSVLTIELDGIGEVPSEEE
jgi:hypothetical protein